MARLVRAIYCGRMEIRELCTEVCEDCKARLLDAFEFKGQARSPQALLIWKLKNAVAAAEEVRLAEKGTPKNPAPRRTSLGEVVPTSEANPFDAFLKSL